MSDLAWLDEIIEKQKVNTDLMNKVSDPLTPAELCELADCEGFDY